MTTSSGDSVSRLTDVQAHAIATSGMSQEPQPLYRGPQNYPGDELWRWGRSQEYNAAIKAWRESEEYKRSRNNKRYLLFAFLGIVVVTACLTFTLTVFVRSSWHVWSPVLFSGAIIAICVGWFYLLAVRGGNISQKVFVQSYLAEKEMSPAQEPTELPDHWLTDPDLQNLIILNRTQIGVYQDIATGDAKRAARNSQVAMSIGFLMLIAGAAITVRVPSAASKIVVGVLAALGSALSGYIGQTFLKAQDQAMRQLNFYFRQPLVTSYMLAAERLTQKLPPGTQQSSLKDLIKNVLLAANRAQELDSAQPAKSRRRNQPSSTNESSAAKNGAQSNV